MKKIILFLSILALIGSPVLASAQANIPDPGETVLAGGPGGVVDLIRIITNWMFTILLVLAVVFILLAAYKYLMSGGGEEVGAAHKMLLYAVVAIAVAFLAKGIVFVVAELVTSGGGSSSLNGGYGDNGGNLQIQYQTDKFGVRIGL